MKNFVQRLGFGPLILACAAGAARTHQPYPPLESADGLAALGKLAAPLRAPSIGLTL
ncbi:MAG: hypothetical protein HY525_18340 [Betaproteobacteria bacterium]|nr:hypothetical protein [Betaproteobacteria bacterium]